MRLIGKRSQEWNRIKKTLKSRFEESPYCRFRGCNCKGYADGFAHSLKRRNMGKWGTEEREENLMKVVPLCNNCHETLEIMGEEIMEQEIERLISIEDRK